MEKTNPIPFKISEAKKKEGRYCCAYACGNDPIKRKGGLCHKHYNRKRKAIDPVYDRFNNFKSNAVNRGKKFSIPLDQFRVFCDTTGYIVKKGMRGKRASIDRTLVEKGYSIDNITIMTLRANVKKWHNEDKKRIEQMADCPF